MFSPTRLLRPCQILAFLALIGSLSGCGKAGPAAVKGLTRGEQAAVKGLTRGEQAAVKGLTRGEQAAVKQEGRSAGKARKEVMNFAKDVGGDLGKEIVKSLFEQWQQQMEAPRSDSSGAFRPLRRFPYPVSSVRPLPGYRPIYDPGSGHFAVPNNYGGVNLYEADGNPIGFSALNVTTGQIDCFDRFGNEV